jgi:hypothetical protein
MRTARGSDARSTRIPTGFEYEAACRGGMPRVRSCLEELRPARSALSVALN